MSDFDGKVIERLTALEREVERLQVKEQPVGAWQSYTVSWTAATTNPSIGNGTLTGRYVQIGKTVICAVSLTMGSTTTYGSGSWNLSLPKTSANSGVYYGGQWMAVDLGTTNHAGQVFLLPNASVINYFLRENVVLDYLNNITPHTWASGDVLRFSVTYETA